MSATGQRLLRSFAMKQVLLTLCCIVITATVLTAARRPSPREELADLQKRVKSLENASKANTHAIECLLANRPECVPLSELVSGVATYEDELLHHPLEVGHVGRFLALETLQIQDGLNMIATAEIKAEGSRPVPPDQRRRRRQTFGTIESGRLTIAGKFGISKGWYEKEIKVWIKGVPTRKLADGVKTDSTTLFAITGTKQYDTTDGSITVFVAELTRDADGSRN